ncbi:Ribulose bisphosphate carboxylase small chain [Spatholobus suberectus]|nr:Ribulose bisphosphate carboxylase small chain [Spatholobus suberectus]
MSAGTFAASVSGAGFVGLKFNCPSTGSIGWERKIVSNGSKTYCMKTWNPINNKKFETLSYLPPLSDESIAKEIDYMLKKGWIPCLEFDELGIFVEKTVVCQATMMGGIGRCGSYQCLVAPTLPNS